MSSGTSWATVTCGWYGNDSDRASGPRRTSVESSSQLPIPRATATKTTSETGRKVPVPDRCMSNGGGGGGAAPRRPGEEDDGGAGREGAGAQGVHVKGGGAGGPLGGGRGVPRGAPLPP